MRFIIGCDFHPSYQQIAMLDTQTGEVVEKSLAHEHKEEVKNFYAGLPGQLVQVRMQDSSSHPVVVV